MKSRAKVSEAARFLKALDGTAKSFCFRTFTDDKRKLKKKGPNGKKRDPLSKLIDGSFEDCTAGLEQRNNKGAGVFVVVNAGGQKDEEITSIRAVFADFDGAGVEKIDEVLKPHIIVESSPGHHHAYWLVDGLEVSRFEEIQRSIAKKFGSDPTICNTSRVMRLPGFCHQKTPALFRTKLLEMRSFSRYQPSDLARAFLDGKSGTSTKTKHDIGVKVVAEQHHVDLLTLTRSTAMLEVTHELPRGPILRMLRKVSDVRYTGREMPDDEIKRAHVGAVKKILRGKLPGNSSSADGRAQVVYVPGSSHMATDAAEAALIDSRSDLYVRGRQLMRYSSSYTGEGAEQPSLVCVTDPWLVDAIGRAAQCVKSDGFAIEWPKSVAHSLIARADETKFPRLRGIVQTPLLRSNGSVGLA